MPQPVITFARAVKCASNSLYLHRRWRHGFAAAKYKSDVCTRVVQCCRSFEKATDKRRSHVDIVIRRWTRTVLPPDQTIITLNALNDETAALC